MNATERLMRIAERYTTERASEGIVCAFAGGSVGRGDADEYSDLDLNFYVTDMETPSGSFNVMYEGETIQLHVHRLPEWSRVTERPWSYRFLHEARTVYDPGERFMKLRTEAVELFFSEQGSALMLEQANQTVEDRKAWAARSLLRDEPIQAGIAASAAWTDAAFAYLWFAHNRLGTGQLLPTMRELACYEEYRKLSFVVPPNGWNPAAAPESVHRYRRHLNPADQTAEFSLDPAQDALTERKASRLLALGDEEQLRWLLQAEAFWMYLSTSGSVSFDSHYHSLPEAVRHSLRELGLLPMTAERVHALCALSDRVMEEAERARLRRR